MSEQPLELVPLAVLTVRLRDPLVVDPNMTGGRWIFEVDSGTVEGDRLRGSLKGQANADWLIAGPNGVGTLDVRALIETHDGALVYTEYLGRTDLSAGGTAPVYAAPRFETSDDRYTWLNTIQAVGKGILEGQILTYQLYELR